MRQLSAISIVFIIALLVSANPVKAQDTLKVMASGSQAVPPASTNGTGIFTIIKTKDSLTVKGEFEKLRGYFTGAYIQMAEPGESGNVLYSLTASNLNEDHTAGAFKAEENTFYTPESIEKYYRKDMLYINIATNINRGGEIRAQIK